MQRIVGFILGALLMLTASCGSEADGQVKSLGDLFGAAASHRVFVDNTFGGADVFDRVSVVSVVGQPTEEGLDVRFGASDRDLTADERESIVSALAEKRVTFVPVGTAPTSDEDTLEAVLSFAEPSGGGDEAVLTTSIACGGTCGAGGAQRFELRETGWRFVETVGPQWIS